MELNKQENESELQYIWRLCSAKDSGILEITWPDLADILNKNLYDEDCYLNESSFRKKYQNAKKFYEEVFSKLESDDYYDELQDQKRELEQLKIQYRDERNAWNKQNYLAARTSQKLDYLESQLKEIGKKEFKPCTPTSITGDNDLLILLTDWHIGQCFESFLGSYNSIIAKERLSKLLSEILEIQKRHGSRNCYVFLGGDIISGNIHKTVQITNRENVIDQIKTATELLTNFCYGLCLNFEHVYLGDVTGNHSRIDKKEDSLHDERLDTLISWGASMALDHVENFHCLNYRHIDSGIIDFSIRGKIYVGVHGDMDNFSKSGISNLCMSLGFLPYAVLCGHLHTAAFDEVAGVKMIRGGSLAGSGDQYTVEKRLSGKPCQVVCVCNKHGVSCYYPIEL